MKKPFDLHVIKFGLIGIMNTAIDFGIFTLLTMVFAIGSVISHVISYSCGVINSYFFNRTWTFQRKDKSSAAEFIKFVVVNLISLGVSSLVMYLLAEIAGLHIYISKLAAVFCSLAVNFAGSKLFVFREQTL